jgi:hypothetical protein
LRSKWEKWHSRSAIDGVSGIPAASTGRPLWSVVTICVVYISEVQWALTPRECQYHYGVL